jgi:hypothetical protein
MGTAGIILAATPLVRLLFEVLGLLKKSEKIKKATHIASGVGVGVLSQIVL